MKKLFIILSIITFCFAGKIKAQLIINEMMQSNIDCIMDDTNEFPDSWVELYNSGTSTVNLSQYKIGLTSNVAEAWHLPNKSIAAKGYMIIYCDKNATGLHTDFRLESGKGGAVYLFNNDTQTDAVKEMKKQPAPNIAYGRQTDGADTWGYQVTPTPGAANCGKLCSKILDEPIFSEKGFATTGPKTISLALTMPEGTPAGTQIRVTYDGTEPTSSSVLYTAPITINTTRVVRAKPFCDGYLSPRSVAQSYIYFPRDITLPVISVVTNSGYFYDDKLGIYVDGTYNSGIKNYEYEWRRPVNVEMFEAKDVASCINQLCETRVMGGATRSNPLKSLAVYANKRFGNKRFEYEFFPDQRPGHTDYKSFQLRNAGNDFDYLYMRDAVIQRIMAQNADLDWQAWRPAIVYINGTYKGMLNIRERSNEDNIYTNYDGLEDIDMVENWSELKVGDLDNFNKFTTFYNEHGHTMAEYEQWMDCYEYINLMAMNLYFNNQDFPGNNFVMWRPRTDGGRWRFVAKDVDFGLGLYGSAADYKTIVWLYTPDYDSNRAWANSYDQTRLFRRLMEDKDFAREFIDRTAIYMGDFLNEKGTRAVWDPMYDIIKYEYPYHRALFNQWWSDYNTELSTARNWLSARTSNFYQQLADYYSLGVPTGMVVNKSLKADDLSKVRIAFNGVTLTKGTFDGKFFAGRSVSLEGTPVDDGKVVTGWDITQVLSAGSIITSKVTGNKYTFNMPVCNTLSINAILGNVDGIDNVPTLSWKWNINSGTLSLTNIQNGTKVCLYDTQGMLYYQGIVGNGDISIPLNKKFYILKVGADVIKITNND